MEEEIPDEIKELQKFYSQSNKEADNNKIKSLTEIYDKNDEN